MEDRAFHLLLLTIVCILLLLGAPSLLNHQQKVSLGRGLESSLKKPPTQQQSSLTGSKLERTGAENAQLTAFVLSMINQNGERLTAI